MVTISSEEENEFTGQLAKVCTPLSIQNACTIQKFFIIIYFNNATLVVGKDFNVFSSEKKLQYLNMVKKHSDLFI